MAWLRIFQVTELGWGISVVSNQGSGGGRQWAHEIPADAFVGLGGRTLPRSLHCASAEMCRRPGRDDNTQQRL